MNPKRIVSSIVIPFLFCCSAFAEHNLSSSEITQLFQDLTNNPRKTWIPAGTMEVTTEEYRAPQTTNEQEILNAISVSVEKYLNDDQKPEIGEQLQKKTLEAIPFNTRYRLSDEYTMKTTSIVKYDGTRYYCDITVNSRQDSVDVPTELQTNDCTEEYNLNWNGRKIIAYDGEKSTFYNPVMHHASIDSTNINPTGSIYSLVAGIVPWGFSDFTYEKLIKVQSSATEKVVDGHNQVSLKLTNPDGTELSFVLDSEKNNAPLSWVINKPNYTITHQYSGYKLVSGSWIPTSITIEKFDKTLNKLLEGNYLTITSIDGQIPSLTSFNVDISPNTLVEYLYDVTKPELIYYSSNTANTPLLLAERMAYMAADGTHTQNCATESLQYAALQLGKDILNQRLSQLVNPEDDTTNMKSIKDYAENLGFYCQAVTTDIQTLKSLSGCQAVLYIPGKKHFVLLDHVDQKYVWTIDLTQNKFYSRHDVNFYGMSWTGGIALLVSNQQISLPEGTVEIPDAQLVDYVGGSGWTCTYKIQDVHMVGCELLDPFTCVGKYEMWYIRYACELAESGECPEDIFIKKLTWPCYNEGEPYWCSVLSSERKTYYMWACN